MRETDGEEQRQRSTGNLEKLTETERERERARLDQETDRVWVIRLEKGEESMGRLKDAERALTESETERDRKKEQERERETERERERERQK